ncbi:four helix bundle protein [Balneolaceae bacterium YR4-1]|uniref:Four helix bundle protein n=1 Tax=Halalkalibaculum roseum TaxID=2709311 RepID=A0A6M1SXT0_9BACT|nr:four helix bundle protein [Halalkalibaculum roseum]
MFRDRTKAFAISVIKICRELPRSREFNIISYQLLRSSTSVASNYRAACRARSTKEFYAKLCIVVEEADECIFWLELLMELEGNKNGIKILMQEGKEILYISAKSKKTTGGSL